jgi:hypothetical protein
MSVLGYRLIPTRKKRNRKMTVSVDYIANLVAELNADKAIAEAQRIALIDDFDDCSQCGESIDDSFGCYFCD